MSNQVKFKGLDHKPLGRAQLNLLKNRLEVSNIGDSGNDGYEVLLTSGISSINTVVSQETFGRATEEKFTAIGKSSTSGDVKTAEIKFRLVDGKIRIEPGDIDPEVTFKAKAYLQGRVIKEWDPSENVARAAPWWLIVYVVTHATLYYENTTTTDGNTTTDRHEIGGNWEGRAEDVSDESGNTFKADRVTLTFSKDYDNKNDVKKPVSLQFRAKHLPKIDIKNYEF